MAGAGHLVPDEEQIEHILNGLSSEYESFVTSISSRPGGTGEPDIRELRSLLLIQENHLDITNEGQETLLQGSTNIAVQNGNKKKYLGFLSTQQSINEQWSEK